MPKFFRKLKLNDF